MFRGGGLPVNGRDHGKGIRAIPNQPQGEPGSCQQGDQIGAEAVRQDDGPLALQVSPQGGGQREKGGAHWPVKQGRRRPDWPAAVVIATNIACRGQCGLQGV